MTQTLVSLFSGALGFDLGLQKAGFVLKAVVECDPITVETIRGNLTNLGISKLAVINKALSLENVREVCDGILERAGVNEDGCCLLAGAPPCQPFSTAGKRASLRDVRSCGFEIFLRAVRILRPKFFVIENVRGVVSAAKKHRPLAERGPGFPPLTPDEEHGSAFRVLLDSLSDLCETMGYCIGWGLVNAANYGVPQIRERLLMIGSLDGHFIWPEPTHSRTAQNGKKKWMTLRNALRGLKELKPDYKEFSKESSRYLRLIPQGCNWRSLPKDVQAVAIGAAFKSWGGRSGFLRRLSWCEPAPTITSNPKTRATMLCHPTEIRPLSVRECARLQQFPDDWQFAGSLSAQYRQVGNATPVGLGEAVGRAIMKALRSRRQGAYGGMLLCADTDLLNRIASSPKTILNPLRMRKETRCQDVAAWSNGKPNRRTEFLRYRAIGSAKQE